MLESYRDIPLIREKRPIISNQIDDINLNTLEFDNS